MAVRRSPRWFAARRLITERLPVWLAVLGCAFWVGVAVVVLYSLFLVFLGLEAPR
jgi:hypothetical protein